MNCNYHTLRLYELGSTTGCNSIFDCGSNLCKWQPTHFRFSNCNSAIFLCAQIHSFIHYDEVAGNCTVRSCQILRVVLQVLVVLGVKCLTFSLRRRSVSRGLSVCLSGWQFLVIHPSVQRQKRLCVWFSCCRPKHIFWRFTFRTYIFCRFARCGPVGNSSQFYDRFLLFLFSYYLFMFYFIFLKLLCQIWLRVSVDHRSCIGYGGRGFPLLPTEVAHVNRLKLFALFEYGIITAHQEKKERNCGE